MGINNLQQINQKSKDKKGDRGKDKSQDERQRKVAGRFKGKGKSNYCHKSGQRDCCEKLKDQRQQQQHIRFRLLVNVWVQKLVMSMPKALF